MYYTAKEIENKMHEMAIRKEQMQELCRRKDKDVFDIIYNVSINLREWDPDLEKRLKDRAVVGKRTLLDRTKTYYEQENNFNSMIKFIEEIYTKAFTIMFGNIKR